MIKKLIVFSDMEFDEASGHNRSDYYGYLQGFSDDDSDVESYETNMDDSNMRAWERGERKRQEKALERRLKGWETDYEAIQRKFRETGFTKVPEIVFWNLRHSSATPVHANQSDVALVSGFSKNMAKLFLDNGEIVDPLNGEIVDPVTVVKQAISGFISTSVALTWNWLHDKIYL